MPTELESRSAALDELGHLLFDDLVRGALRQSVLDASNLSDVLDPSASARLTSHRFHTSLRGTVPRGAREQLQGTDYLGVCVQDSRDEQAHQGTGLREDAWTLRRVLVAAHVGPRRIALWVDGVFVFTDLGLRALDIERIEEPRWEHADLELVPCDMATDLGQARLSAAPRQ
jgi:hypothetical protein